MDFLNTQVIISTPKSPPPHITVITDKMLVHNFLMSLDKPFQDHISFFPIGPNHAFFDDKYQLLVIDLYGKVCLRLWG